MNQLIEIVKLIILAINLILGISMDNSLSKNEIKKIYIIS